MSKLQYTAEIQGDEAPFRWKLQDPTGANKTSIASGESETYADAMAAASMAAHDFERRRRHTKTVRKEVVLEVDESIPPAEGLEVPDYLPED